MANAQFSFPTVTAARAAAKRLKAAGWTDARVVSGRGVQPHVTVCTTLRTQAHAVAYA